MIDLSVVLRHGNTIESVERRRMYFRSALKSFRGEEMNNEEKYILIYEFLNEEMAHRDKLTPEELEAYKHVGYKRVLDYSSNGTCQYR
jgi:hypothetical protein